MSSLTWSQTMLERKGVRLIPLIREHEVAALIAADARRRAWADA